MRNLLLAAGAALTLSACGGSDTDTATDATGLDANMMATDNMAMDQNMAMNDTMDTNMAVDPATQNMIQQDMNTNSPDTNLANGM